MDSKMESAGYDIIYLAGCAVNNITPDSERIEAMDMESVCRMSRFCGISALVWQAAGPFVDRDSDLAKCWREYDAKALERYFRFKREREQVFSFFEDNYIRYAPLKGLILKDYYPEPYTREMADNDILINADALEKVREWFLNRGYQIQHYNIGIHYAFYKKPIYNFEIHNALFGPEHDPVLQDYYKNIWDRLIRDGDGCYCYHLPDDDFYIYFILHDYRHYTSDGIGIRSLLDCYIYTKAFKGKLGQEYIRRELAGLGAADYEKQVFSLAWKLFDDPEKFSAEELEDTDRTFLSDLMRSGTSGTLVNRVRRGLQEADAGEGKASGSAKLRYLWHRAFPSAEVIAVYAPAFGRHRWLIPYGYVYRLVRTCVKRRDLMRSEITILRKM